MLKRNPIEGDLAHRVHLPLLTNEIGFPGWPDLNLDWVVRLLGGRFKKLSEKGACTGPLFFFPPAGFPNYCNTVHDLAQLTVEPLNLKL